MRGAATPPGRRPPRIPGLKPTFSTGDLSLDSSLKPSFLHARAELEREQMLEEEAILAGLRRRLGTWKPSSPAAASGQRGAFDAEDFKGSPRAAVGTASDPVAVGFVLQPLDAFGSSHASGTTLGTGATLSGGGATVGTDRLGASESRGTQSMTGASASSSMTPDRPRARVRTSSEDSPSRAQRWKRQARNRQGCSDEVKARERRLLEQMVQSCGLELAQGPDGEVLKATPSTTKKPTAQEQSEATRKLLCGLSATHKGAHRKLDRSTPGGGSAARLLRSEKQRLGMAGEKASTEEQAASFPEGAATDSARAGIPDTIEMTPEKPTAEKAETPVRVHGLPPSEISAILKSAMRGNVPVHLTQGPQATSKPTAAFEGVTPPPDLQQAVLVAALKGQIPVRSISTAGSSKGSSDLSPGKPDFSSASISKLLGHAGISGLYLAGHLPGLDGSSEASDENRGQDLEEPDQELTPRCPAEGLSHPYG